VCVGSVVGIRERPEPKGAQLERQQRCGRGSGRGGRNMGNGSIGVSKGKVFCREWLNFGAE
jgi:hypothetical protein